MMILGKAKPTEEGVDITAKRADRGAFVEWENILRIDRNENRLRIWYRGPDDKPAVIFLTPADDQKDEALIPAWRNFLVRRVQDTGQLEGSIHGRTTTSRWDRIISLASFLMMIGIGIYTIVKAILAIMNTTGEFRTLAMVVAYYIALPGGFFFLCVPLMLLLRMQWLLRSWRSWRIDKTGFFRKDKAGAWRRMHFAKGDKITNGEITVDGSLVPVSLLTMNAPVPHLLSILASREGVETTPTGNLFLWPAIRMITVWPLIVTAYWLLPFMLWDLSAIDFPISKGCLVCTLGCIGFGLFKLGLGFWPAWKYRRDFPEFEQTTSQIRTALGW